MVPQTTRSKYRARMANVTKLQRATIAGFLLLGLITGCGNGEITDALVNAIPPPNNNDGNLAVPNLDAQSPATADTAPALSDTIQPATSDGAYQPLARPDGAPAAGAADTSAPTQPGAAPAPAPAPAATASTASPAATAPAATQPTQPARPTTTAAQPAPTTTSTAQPTTAPTQPATTTAATNPPQAGIVEFRIPAGTGNGAWNTFSNPVVVKVGDTLRIHNDDSKAHAVHARGTPIGHGNTIQPGESRDHQVKAASQPAQGQPVAWDHFAGTGAPFWIMAS